MNYEYVQFFAITAVCPTVRMDTWLVRATQIWVLFFAHIPFMVNRAFNAALAESL